MTEAEEEKLFDGLTTLTEMLKQVQTTVLANQAVLMAYLSMERVNRPDGDEWFQNLTASTSATLAGVILEYGPLGSNISERTRQVLENIGAAKLASTRDEN